MTPQGYALHIGLNAVNPDSYEGWNGELFACENDAAVYKALAEKAGFQSIYPLLTKDATSQNVLQHLSNAASQLQAGDILLLTYSGHGGAIIDTNHDETNNFGEMDGFDETWCLYDRQLIDDELFECFSKFKPGVRILIFSDSCHSGSVARAAEAVTTTTDAATYIRARVAPLDVLVRTYNNHKSEYDGIQAQLSAGPADIAAYVVQFGACQDDELAMEVWGNGMFTAKVQEVMKEEISSYTALFVAIKQGFSAQQHPNLFHYGNKAYDFLAQAPFSIQPLVGA
ncbi:caspase family protein [Chitinophaga ginsengisoli]|uniref:Caspase domain-containing protein n=1 Tax=Chitinophaga ginsengisoli TaxID=363837 RepID=A0A2P8GHW0_9BACT|nr:caspase family protein [Chitinophaga ginsengisoli]PSL33527.1 caspase domain-containing protein [Chitinophaga ginsengisoli]